MGLEHQETRGSLPLNLRDNLDELLPVGRLGGTRYGVELEFPREQWGELQHAVVEIPEVQLGGIPHRVGPEIPGE